MPFNESIGVHRSRSLKCLRIVHPAKVPPLRILEVPPPKKNCQLRILACKNHMLPTSTFKETWIILDPTINRFSIHLSGKMHPFTRFLSHRRQRSTLGTCRLTKTSVRQMVVIPPCDLEVNGNHGFDRLFAIISSRETQDFLKQTSWSIHTALVRITVWKYALNRFTRWFW